MCSHFGWTLDYLLWEVDYSYLQRMLIDAPSYDYDNEDDNSGKGSDSKPGKTIKYSDLSSEDLQAQMEKYK